MAIWNNNTCNSHREFYKQHGTTPLNAQGVHNLSYFDQFILQNGVTLANSLFQFIGQNVDFDGSSSSSSSSGDAEIIRGHIDKILNNYRDKGYDADNVDELEALLEVYEDNKVKNDDEFNRVNGLIANNDSEIKSTKTKINTLEGSISNLEREIDAREKNGEDTLELKSQLDAEKVNLQKAEDELTKLKENQKDLAAQKAVLDDENEDLKNLKTDIQKLKTYMKDLKKAEGRNAIEGLVNEDTGNITDLIDKYNRNPEDKKLEGKLKEALQKYVDNTENPSPTIVKYAEIKFKIVKQ